MSRLWLVAGYEYKRQVFRKSFILILLSVPLVLALMIGLGYLIDRMENPTSAIGYVDLSGFLADPIPAPQRAPSPDSPTVSGLVPLIRFATEEEARAALERKEIQAYYVLTPDYLESRRVELVYIKPPGDNAIAQFWDFMQINGLRDLPPEIARRVTAGANLIVRWPEDGPGGGREFSQRTFWNNLLPMFVGIAFIMLVFMSSGFLMQAVTEEKENRTMEIVVTSISPSQLMAGKVFGIAAVSLTQLLAWAMFVALAVVVGGQYLGIGWLRNLSVDPRLIAMMLIIAAPTYILVAALMTMVGATVTEGQEAQQFAGLFNMPFVVPVWFAPVFIENPSGPLAIILSLFPPTALTTLAMRMMTAPVPLWQIGLSAAILLICAGGAVWLAGRAFRLGMLRYGQRVNWREIIAWSRPRLATGDVHE